MQVFSLSLGMKGLLYGMKSRISIMDYTNFICDPTNK